MHLLIVSWIIDENQKEHQEETKSSYDQNTHAKPEQKSFLSSKHRLSQNIIYEACER